MISNKILIIGLGRIGKHFLRIFITKNSIQTIYVNDLNKNIENHVYLLNYDNIYGLREKRFIKQDQKTIFDTKTNKKIIFCELTNKNINKFLFIVDSTGAKEVLDKISNYNSKVFVTNSSEYKIDKFLISNYPKQLNVNDKIISTSICDATAIYPIIKIIDQKQEILNGHVTTIHPWLSYQNLLDGNVESMQLPKNYIKDYELGRKSTETLIPKSTSVLDAIAKIDKKITRKFSSFSLRSPHPIVSAAILNLNIKKNLKDTKVFKKLFNNNNFDIVFSETHQVSTDYIESYNTCVIQEDQIKLSKNNINIMIWYDNEYGYSYQVSKLILKILNL